MFKKFRRGEGKRGFTLIELLVVIAIIGILSSVVLASLNTARKKSRDARRLSDIKQAQLALEMYFDSQSPVRYPASSVGLADLVTGKFLPTLPEDPNGTAYKYCSNTDGTSYHLGAVMENSSNPAFKSDSDVAAGVDCEVGDTKDFEGLSIDCGATALGSDVGDLCYDVTP